MTIQLDFHTDLPKIRKAFDQQKLQAQKQSFGAASYQGPCAIGVLLTQEQQRLLDTGRNGYMIANILANGEFLIAPKDQHQDWIELQLAHDHWLARISGKAEAFAQFLTELEVKYASA